MARRRRPLKRHVQLALLDATGTKPKSRRGGKRRGAGRPPNGSRSSSPHKKRAQVDPSTPQHVVMRVVPEIGLLRRRTTYEAIREATIAMVEKHPDCRIVQLSIQQNHLHALVEADDADALARGMKAFQGSAAKRINKVLGRARGKVFEDRYHTESIESPRQARRALAYVLNNWRKHGQDVTRSWNVDPFSSGWQFAGWAECEGEDFVRMPPATYQSLLVWFPRSWLLTQGWGKHGLISYREVPSKKRIQKR